MRHDIFVRFTELQGAAVWVNPCAVVAIIESQPTGDNLAFTIIATSSGEGGNLHVVEQHEDVVRSITQAGYSVPPDALAGFPGEANDS